jgi:hypothetical protein
MRDKKPTPREYAVASHLIAGDKPSVACRKAGYSESVVKSTAAKIARRDTVRLAMIQLGQGINVQDLGAMAKVRLQEDLLKPPKGDKGAKARLGIVRTAGEMAGLIGGPSELHLHNHAELPPVVQQMLISKMREILANEHRQTIDAEVIETRPAETPQATEPINSPVNDISAEPKKSFAQRQDEYLVWQAGLMSKF